jgi:hypothetical protein
MELIKQEDRENPICPHCDKEMTQIVAKQFDKSWLGIMVRFIYSCPHCRKVLGIGQSMS